VLITSQPLRPEVGSRHTQRPQQDLRLVPADVPSIL